MSKKAPNREPIGLSPVVEQRPEGPIRSPQHGLDERVLDRRLLHLDDDKVKREGPPDRQVTRGPKLDEVGEISDRDRLALKKALEEANRDPSHATVHPKHPEIDIPLDDLDKA